MLKNLRRFRLNPVSYLGKIFVYSILILWALISLLPIYWMLTSSLKPPSLAIAIPPEWFPKNITFANFSRMFNAGPIFRSTINSVFVSSTVTIIYLLTSSMAGYAFAKKEFWGKNIIFGIYLSTMLMPGFVTLVTAYTVIVDLGWIDTYWALIIPELAGPFGAFMLRQFIQGLPSELFDAAKIDGCSEWGVFWRIVAPLAAPGLAVLAIFTFSAEWNSFIWPLTVTKTDAMRTLPVALAGLQRLHSTNFSLLMAGATYTALPMIIIFIFAQKYFLKGITMGAIKG